MAQALRQSMPSMKTQAQFTAFMATFDSLRLLCDSICSEDTAREAQSRETFERALGAVRTATELGRKFEDIPVESRGTASNPFTNPPTEFSEYDIQKKLLSELSRITGKGELNEWYVATKANRDRVVSQTLRNVLMDSIREKNSVLERTGESS